MRSIFEMKVQSNYLMESSKNIKSGSVLPESRDKETVNFIRQEMMDVFPDMCFVIAEDGTIMEANARGHELLIKNKISSAHLFHKFLLKEYQKLFLDKLRTCIKENVPAMVEAELHTGLNVFMSTELFLRPITTNRTSPQGSCFLIVRDISDKKKQELDLLRFTNLAHFSVNPIEITDTSGNIIYVNPAFERASGYTQEELRGKNPNVFSSQKHSKVFWEKMWDTISSGKVWVGEVENRKRNGDPYYTQLLVSPIVSANGKIVGYFGIHRDISDQRNLEQQLIHAQKMESIGMLAAGLAHEVGNPLASISSLVQILQRTSEDEFIQDKLELIKSQINRISRIIRDLVDFSRKSNYEMQLTDINKIIRDAIEIIRVSKKAKDLNIEATLDPNAPLLMLVPDQIEQVFINLILNSVDALYDQSTQQMERYGKAKKTIAIQSYMQDGAIYVTVEDNGKGIRSEDIPKIFEPFFTTKNVGEGTGLGLWVSYGIVKSFRGEIRVKSTEGYGTTFTVKLPLQSI
jgi:PAS domain S-box-containing protein